MPKFSKGKPKRNARTAGKRSSHKDSRSKKDPGTRFGRGKRESGARGSKFGAGKRESGGKRPGFQKDIRVVCDGCGAKTTVPFRPVGDKPVYCSECFGRKNNQSSDRKSSGGGSKELRDINKKLDKIIKFLELD